jgi:hypothetical protein
VANDAEPKTLSQKVVALAADHFSLGLPRLSLKFRFLAFDPPKFADHRQPHGVIADP